MCLQAGHKDCRDDFGGKDYSTCQDLGMEIGISQDLGMEIAIFLLVSLNLGIEICT